MKKIEETEMQIVKHQERIIFNEMKMFEHKIMLKMN